MNPKTIFIVEDHPLFRLGLREMIAEEQDYEITGETDNGLSALDTIQKTKPDIIFVDIGLPKLDGLELIRRLRNEPDPPLSIVLTMNKNERIFNEAINAGINAYVLKDDAPHDIRRCLKVVSDGEFYVSSAVSGFLMRRAGRHHAFQAKAPTLDALTPMERRILKLIAQNKTTKMIADELFISPHTVETHRCNICGKLELSGSQPVLRFALEHRDEL
jgi:DNA-binding NarL/FixJ family response regulator